MEVTATTRYIRTSPRKLRLVADAIRGLPALKAQVFLDNVEKRAAEPLSKTVKSAVANAVNNFGLTVDGLKIKKVVIDSGPIYKRFQPVSRGQAHEIKKRTSHIIVTVEGEKKEETKKEQK